MPKLSVIIPAHNAEQTIEKCISSVLMQSFPDWELFVVCDNCTDKTAEIVRRIAEIEQNVRSGSTTQVASGFCSLIRMIGICMSSVFNSLWIEPRTAMQTSSHMISYGNTLALFRQYRAETDSSFRIAQTRCGEGHSLVQKGFLMSSRTAMRHSTRL